MLLDVHGQAAPQRDHLQREPEMSQDVVVPCPHRDEGTGVRGTPAGRTYEKLRCCTSLMVHPPVLNFIFISFYQTLFLDASAGFFPW